MYQVLQAGACYVALASRKAGLGPAAAARRSARFYFGRRGRAGRRGGGAVVGRSLATCYLLLGRGEDKPWRRMLRVSAGAQAKTQRDEAR